MRRTLALLTLLLALLAGCDSPERGFERFYDAVGRDDVAAIGETVTAQSNTTPVVAALRKRPPAASVKRIVVVERGAERAVVEVEDLQGHKERVVMRHEQDRWRVDLLAQPPAR